MDFSWTEEQLKYKQAVIEFAHRPPRLAWHPDVRGADLGAVVEQILAVELEQG